MIPPHFFRTVRFALGLALAPIVSHAAEAPDYHAEIAPLLRQYCAGCHNDDEFEGDFSVERYADLREGGSKGVMLRPGNPDDSYLIKLLTGGTEDPMPPKDEPQPSAAEVSLLRQWIASGAAGPKTEAEDISILSTLTVPELARAPGERAITALARSADGRRMAKARFESVVVSENDRPLRRLDSLAGKINAVHFSQDGGQLVTASGIEGLKGVATIWDLATGEPVREFGEGYHRDILYDAEWSPDGALLATAGYDGKIALWEAATGKRLRTIEVHNGAVYDLAFSPDGTVLASASGDATVKLWRVADGERLDTLNQPQGEQYAVKFTPDGKHIIAAGADNRIRIYRFISREKPAINPLLETRFAHEQDVVALDISADGKWLVSAGDDRTVKLWALPSLAQSQAWEHQSDIVAALALAGDQIVVGRLDGSSEALPVRFSVPVMDKGGSPAPPEPEPESPEPREEKIRQITAIDQEIPFKVNLPSEISSAIETPGDTDTYRFSAKAGEKWVLEVKAARMKSPLDSKLELLTADGEPIERVRLQAVRDSWFEFRGKDSTQVGDFRVFNWREMELNEFLYCNGEVVRLWLAPRGPDSGFTVYPGIGNRHTYFGTSGLSHALGEPCYVVRPLPPGAEPVPNGLPVYTIYYENDDDPRRRGGSDSVLDFTAPSDGDYLVRISDVRGFGGEDFSYHLTIRSAKPDYSVKLETEKDFTFAPGGGREFVVTADRLDGFEGEIEIRVENLPPGFTSGGPLVIETGQHQAMGTIHAAIDAPAPAPEAAKGVKLIAEAIVGGNKITHSAGNLSEIKLDPKGAKVMVEIMPDGDSGAPKIAEGKPLELTIHPGETISAKVRATRLDFKDRIEFGTDDSGRNLAHGLIIDNIGLNGLMIPEESSEGEFFITAAKWVPESSRTFHLRTKNAGGQASRPIILHVKNRPPES